MSLDKHIELLLAIQEVIAIARDKAYGAVNSALLESYWQVGKLIVEEEQNGKARAEYGQGMLKKLAFQLTIQFGKGFDERNLNNMRAFYKAFPIWNAVRTELSWTHYRLLSRMEDKEKRLFYLQQSLESGWNSRALERNIRSLAYERRLEISPQHINNPSSVVLKDPYIFEFLGMDALPKFTERNLETALVNHLQRFLLELGKGFAFVARQQHIVTDTSDFYIDLVFYNYYLKCFVLIDLKADKLTHQDIGQMDMYVRMYEDLKKGPDDNPTIGLILCAEKDETVVKYSVLSDNKQLFASKYMLYMPKEEELKELIEKDRQLFDLGEEEME